jgi:hypothetical protein
MMRLKVTPINNQRMLRMVANKNREALKLLLWMNLALTGTAAEE